MEYYKIIHKGVTIIKIVEDGKGRSLPKAYLKVYGLEPETIIDAIDRQEVRNGREG